MNKLLLLLFLVTFVASVAAQAPEGSILSQKNYLQKSQRQKTTARVLLITGGTLVLTALVIPRGEVTYPGICIFGFCDEERKNDNLKTAVGLTGSAIALSSILFFRASKKNAGRATAMGLKMEQTMQLTNSNFVQRSFPAFHVNVNF